MSSDIEKPQKANIFRTYLDFVASTRFFTTPFSWLYVIVALAFVAIPVLLLVQGLNFEIFKQEGRFILGFILVLIASIAAAIVAFVVAWDGKNKISTEKITIELIIDAVADLLALSIKSQAHFIGVFGFFGGLFALLFGGELLRWLGIGYSPIILMIGAPLLGYGMVWFSRLFKFLFAKIARIVVMVIVQVFKFVVLHVIVTIYKFIAHIVRQLFDYIFILIQAIVDYIVNSLKVIIALVARLGRFLLAYARSPFKNNDYNDAKITYNNE